jgi:hypothetical protein
MTRKKTPTCPARALSPHSTSTKQSTLLLPCCCLALRRRLLSLGAGLARGGSPDRPLYLQQCDACGDDDGCNVADSDEQKAMAQVPFTSKTYAKREKINERNSGFATCCLSVCMSMSVCHFCLSVCQSVCRLFGCLAVYVCVCMCVCLRVCV